jgi:hypothetical protein
MSREYYVNPEAHNNPRQSDILEDLERWMSLYNMDKMIHVVPTPKTEEYTKGVIAGAILARVIITTTGRGTAAAGREGASAGTNSGGRGGGEGEFLVEMLKWSSSHTQTNGPVNITNIQTQKCW